LLLRAFASLRLCVRNTDIRKIRSIRVIRVPIKSAKYIDAFVDVALLLPENRRWSQDTTLERYRGIFYI
jgi:hypothetical protein